MNNSARMSALIGVMDEMSSATFRSNNGTRYQACDEVMLASE